MSINYGEDNKHLRELLKSFKFNVKPDGTEGCYRFNNFEWKPGFGWVCRVESPERVLIMSANVDYCLARALEREYEFTLSNLNYALEKAIVPKVTLEDTPLTWCEAASKLFNEAAATLPNAAIEMMAFGSNFIMTRINSIKQAKKLMKTKAIREAPYVFDRRKRQIVIIDESLITGVKE